MQKALHNRSEPADSPPEGMPPQRSGGRRKGWVYFKTRAEAERELRTIRNLVKRGEIEPARANSATYALATFLNSRKVAEDQCERQSIDQLKQQVLELIAQNESQRQRVAELVARQERTQQ